MNLKLKTGDVFKVYMSNLKGSQLSYWAELLHTYEYVNFKDSVKFLYYGHPLQVDFHSGTIRVKELITYGEFSCGANRSFQENMGMTILFNILKKNLEIKKEI